MILVAESLPPPPPRHHGFQRFAFSFSACLCFYTIDDLWGQLVKGAILGDSSHVSPRILGTSNDGILTRFFLLPRTQVTSIFGRSTLPNKALFNQNKGHLGCRCMYTASVRNLHPQNSFSKYSTAILGT